MQVELDVKEEARPRAGVKKEEEGQGAKRRWGGKDEAEDRKEQHHLSSRSPTSDIVHESHTAIVMVEALPEG